MDGAMSKMTPHANLALMTPKPLVVVHTVLEVHGMSMVPLASLLPLAPVTVPLTGSGGKTKELPKTLEHATPLRIPLMLPLWNAPPVLPAVPLRWTPTQ